METHEELGRRVLREQKLKARLRLAATRLEDAQLERIWAIANASKEGLSIRQISQATGLSPTRVHQLLKAQEAQEIPVWLSQLRERESNPQDSEQGSDPQNRLRESLRDEVEVLRWCIDWLSRLSRGEKVVVNLRPDEDVQTEFVSFDCQRVRRVLSRIASDLESLARIRSEPPDVGVGDEENPLQRHRRRLAEPEPQPKRLSHREERAALRSKLGMPPY
jgi:AraC-like DNA-binding protein